MQSSQENTCTRASFLIKLQAEACTFNKKENLAQLFSCEFWEISKNTFSYKTPLGNCFCFYSRLTSLSALWSSPYYLANTLQKSKDDSVYQFHVVSPSLKLSYIIFVIRLFDFGNNTIFCEKFPQCDENIHCYFG